MKSLSIILESEKTTEDLHHDLTSHYKTEFNHDEKYALSRYTDGSKKINGYHWLKHKHPSHEDLEQGHYTKHLDSVLSKTKTPKKIVLYSGTKHDPREIKNEENIVHHPAYLSASLSKRKSETFAYVNQNKDIENKICNRHLLKIHVPKDHPGAYVGGTDFSLPSEKEFILPRGTNLRHVRTEIKQVRTYRFGGLNDYKIYNHLHHMEVV